MDRPGTETTHLWSQAGVLTPQPWYSLHLNSSLNNTVTFSATSQEHPVYPPHMTSQLMQLMEITAVSCKHHIQLMSGILIHQLYHSQTKHWGYHCCIYTSDIICHLPLTRRTIQSCLFCFSVAINNFYEGHPECK